MNASRAAEYRFHSASSVLRSSPLMVRHSSRISRSRSPAAFHWVALFARSSASAASASLRAVCAARCSSRLALSAAAAGVRVLDDRRQPRRERVDVTEHRSGRQALGKRSCGRLDLAGVAGARLSRLSISATSVSRSSKRRPKWANAASVSPACQEPMARSPAPLISQTVPSGSTRPNRCGSLEAGCVGCRRQCRTGPGAWARRSWTGSGFGGGSRRFRGRLRGLRRGGALVAFLCSLGGGPAWFACRHLGTS